MKDKNWKSHSPTEHAMKLCRECEAALDAGDDVRAEELARETASFLSEGPSLQEFIRLIFRWIERSVDVDRPDTALRLSVLGLEICRTRGSDSLLAEAHELHGRALSTVRENEEAFAQFAVSAKLAEDQSLPLVRANALHGLGVACHSLDRKLEADSYLKEALSLYEQLNSSKKQAYTLYMLGLNSLDMGYPEKALLFHEKSLSLLIAVEDNLQIARSFAEQALALLHLGRYEQALDKNEQALLLHKKQGMSPHLLMLHRADILTMLGRFSEALECLEQSQEICSRSGKMPLITMLNFRKGDILALAGRVSEGLSLIREATALYEQHQPNIAGYARMIIGSILWQSGSKKEAAEEWKAAGETIRGMRQEYWLDCTVARHVRAALGKTVRMEEQDEYLNVVCKAAGQNGFEGLVRLLN